MNEQTVYRRNDCRLCESTDLELALPMRPSPIGDAYLMQEELNERALEQANYPLSLYLCKTCFHLQLPDVVSPKILFENYIYSTSISPGLVTHFTNYANDIMAEIGCPQDGFVLEIGSNDGSLLRAFKQYGMTVLGVDPAKNVAIRATATGIETIPTFFTSALADDIYERYGAADLVAANNVFAHMDNIIDVLKGIERVLAPEGVFVFEVSYLLDMVEKNVFDTIYHEHLSHHSIAPLEAFFNRHGMRLYDIQRVSTKGGSIRCFAKRMSSSRPVKPIVQELIKLEEARGLNRAETFQAFSAHLDSIKADLLARLSEFKVKGKVIAGYGASTPVTTLISQFELASYLTYLLDDNLIKQGRFSPLHHIPVYASDDIYTRKPDCILILAWQYAERIIQMHEQFLDDGGCFIVPLPEMRVYTKETRKY